MSKFELGQLVATPGALDLMHNSGSSTWSLLSRHLQGDWGDLDPKDKSLNDEALKHGGRLFSSYNVADDKVWVITEADRSSTTLLLPSEY